jgi:hypothetical protein
MASRCGTAVDLIQWLPTEAVVLPVQALGGLFNVVVKKAKRPPSLSAGHLDVARRLSCEKPASGRPLEIEL